MEMITNYMKNTFLRHALNALTRQTFGFDFEAWVMNGYFEGDYIPYSFLENGKILSNASKGRPVQIRKRTGWADEAAIHGHPAE